MPWDADKFWADEKRAEGYAKRSFVLPAESTIIARFREEWPRWAVLDLGVGAGRTTEHFAPLCGRYVGSDFSAVMVETCRKRFPQYEFRVEDARAIKAETGSFDFVAFSYNGLGELPADDIPKALAEMRRVLKPGGWLFFSQHNIQWARNIFAVKLSKNPRRLLKSALLARKFRRLNPGWRDVGSRPSAVLRDYPHDFTKTAFWIAPAEQARQLEAVGFKPPEIFLNSNGAATNGKQVAAEPFLHYLTQN